VYHKETAPVKSFYEKQGKLISIQGMGSVDEITERLFVSIDAL
jgi:adenylate kinase